MKNHWIRYWGALTAALLFCTTTVFPIAMHPSADSLEDLEISGTDQNYTFERTGDSVVLTSYTGTETKVSVPATVKVFQTGSTSQFQELPVTALSCTFYDNENITAVTVPASITIIGDSTF